MHFAIDIREACRAKKSGKGQWVHGFTSELLSRGLKVTLLSDTPPPPEWVEQASNVQLFPKGLRWHFRAAQYLKKHKDISVYVSPTSFIVPCIVGGSVHFVPVVHDLIAFRGDPHQLKATLVEKITLRCCLRKSRYILAVSQSTKNDLTARYDFLNPDSISVVYAGPLRNDPPQNISDERTIFCPATLCPRKNQKRLILAYRMLTPELRQQFTLVLVGARGWHDQDIVELAEETEGVDWLDYVPNEQYEQYLNTCTILAMPSLYEGFGMQVLDALQRGIPVLTSEKGSLSEVSGNSAVHVQPEIVEDIARGLTEILQSEELRKELRGQGPVQAAQFTWKRAVDTFLQATEKMPW